MHIRARVVEGTLAALAIAGGAAGIAATQATSHAPGQLTFTSRLTAIRFFTASGPITGFPTSPLVPGDRIICCRSLRVSVAVSFAVGVCIT